MKLFWRTRIADLTPDGYLYEPPEESYDEPRHAWASDDGKVCIETDVADIPGDYEYVVLGWQSI